MVHRIEVNEVPVYEDSRNAVMDTKYPVRLVDGVRDLPFTDLESWTAFMNDFMTDGGEEPGYVIHTYEHYYNRNALTEYIHSLY